VRYVGHLPRTKNKRNCFPFSAYSSSRKTEKQSYVNSAFSVCLFIASLNFLKK